MSKETRTWLSENVLVGFTDKRGNAWHYREGDGNHYPGAIPVEEVQKRLFDWTAEEHPVYIGRVQGDGWVEHSSIPGRKAIARSDNGQVMGLFKESYQPHQYGEWLVKNVGNLLDDDLSIGSAGLLKGGAVAWVSVEVPDTITTPEGVEFRPNLMACTSFDGTVATTYKRVVTNVVCDNTMAAGLGERHDQVVKVRHSKNSMAKLADAREALGIIHQVAEDFEAQVRALCAVDMPERKWDRLMDAVAPMPQMKADGKRTAGFTLAEAKRDKLRTLWTQDARVEPWSGTAYGVWQMLNTYQQHENIVRGTSRPERNMIRVIDGSMEAADAQAMSKVLEMV